MKRSQEPSYLMAKEIFSRIDSSLPAEERGRFFREAVDRLKMQAAKSSGDGK